MVEDDLELAEILSEYLSKYSINVQTVDDPFMALSLIDTNKYDLLILDLSLPGMDGLELCEKILQKHKIPIIISSARSDVTDKVLSLKMGADDYLPKPYDPRELEARIKSVLRRYSHIDDENKEEEEDTNSIFKLDTNKMEIKFDGKILELTSAEYEILAYLITKKGYVISREELIYNIDSINSESSQKSIDVIIFRLRQKIEENPKKPQYLISVRGVGYKIAL
jgi:two-component system OmpR family response regulator